MDVVESVVRFATEAVLRYRTISGRQDNGLPEAFLGGYVAPCLYDQFRWPVHIEHDYLFLVGGSEVPITLKSSAGWDISGQTLRCALRDRRLLLWSSKSLTKARWGPLFQVTWTR